MSCSGFGDAPKSIETQTNLQNLVHSIVWGQWSSKTPQAPVALELKEHKGVGNVTSSRLTLLHQTTSQDIEN